MGQSMNQRQETGEMDGFRCGPILAGVTIASPASRGLRPTLVERRKVDGV